MMAHHAPVRPTSVPRLRVRVARLLARRGARHAGPPDDPGLLWPQQPELQPFALDDARGGTLDLESLRGHWSLVFIGYTQCPDWCPTTLETLAATSAALADEAAWKARGQVLFVSIDAERDTPERLTRYVGHFDAGFRAASAAPERLHFLTTQLDMRYTRLSEGDGSQWSYDHSAHIALIGPSCTSWPCSTRPMPRRRWPQDCAPCCATSRIPRGAISPETACIYPRCGLTVSRSARLELHLANYFFTVEPTDKDAARALHVPDGPPPVARASAEFNPGGRISIRHSFQSTSGRVGMNVGQKSAITLQSFEPSSPSPQDRGRRIRHQNTVRTALAQRAETKTFAVVRWRHANMTLE